MAAKDTKIYYSMGEVAEMMDVSTSLIRFWERKFDILTPHKNKKGNRLFSPEDVRNLKTIYHLVKERGMTLAGADKYLKANRKSIERDMEIAERLGTIRALLLEVRNELGGGGTLVEDDGTEPVIGRSVETVIEETETETETGTGTGTETEINTEINAVIEEAVVIEEAAEEEEVDTRAKTEKEDIADTDELQSPTDCAVKAPGDKPLYIEQTLF